MPNQILKTIKIDVDSSEYKALLKSLNTIASIERQIGLIKQNNEKSTKEQIKDKLKEIELLKAQKKLNDATYADKKKELEAEMTAIKVQEKKIELSKKIKELSKIKFKSKDTDDSKKDLSKKTKSILKETTTESKVIRKIEEPLKKSTNDVNLPKESEEKVEEKHKSYKDIEFKVDDEYKTSPEDKYKIDEAKLEILKSKKAIQDEYYKSKEKELENEIKLLKLDERRIKALEKFKEKEKDARKKEREDKLEKIKDEIKSSPTQRARELAREKAEKGKEYKVYDLSFKGLRESIYDAKEEEIKRQGEQKVEQYNEDIAQQEDIQKLAQAKIDKYKDELENEDLSDTQIKYRKKQISKYEEQKSKAGEKIEDIKDDRSKAIGNTKTALSKLNANITKTEKVMSALSKVGNVLIKPFKDLSGAVVDTVKQMMEFKTGVATYNMSTSLVTNSQAREQQMKYGLTSSQNYAFTQAKSMLNIQSDEDLMYMNSEQRDKFLQYMEKYSQWYDKMEASGVLNDIQEMQLEFQELKQEIAMEFLQWVAENKETIMACIKGIFEFIKTIANVVMGIINILSFGKYKSESIADTSDVKKYEENNDNRKSTVINVNANTTNNATGVLGSQEALNEFNKENFNKLAKQIASVVQ